MIISGSLGGLGVLCWLVLNFFKKRNERLDRPQPVFIFSGRVFSVLLIIVAISNGVYQLFFS